MKTCLKVVAWFGLAIVFLIVLYASWGLVEVMRPSFRGGVDLFPLVYAVSFVGLPFILIGGLLPKPRYFWLGAIIVGVIYILSLSIYIAIVLGRFSFDLISGILLLPGLIIIGEGILLILLRYSDVKHESKRSFLIVFAVVAVVLTFLGIGLVLSRFIFL
jgi:hypothetical protein